MSRFVAVDRDTAYLLPPSVDEWLPQDHLARFVVEVIEQLDLSDLTRQYAGRGSAAHHPAVLLGLLIYGYASGVHSSRKIERATYDSLAFRFIACDRHPDHDTLATFRRRFGKEFAAIFIQVLQVARENQLSRFGTVSLDGTKLRANLCRCRHRAADRRQTRRTSSALARAFRGAGAARRAGQPCRTDAARAQDQGGPRRLCATQADGGAGVRHHQVGDGIPPVPAARTGERPERMDAGLSGVEFEAHGRIASTVAKQDWSIATSWQNDSISVQNTPFRPGSRN